MLGKQQISKFNETAKDDTHLFLATIRLHSFASDIVITYHFPWVGQVEAGQEIEALIKFKEILASLEILDDALFG